MPDRVLSAYIRVFAMLSADDEGRVVFDGALCRQTASRLAQLETARASLRKLFAGDAEPTDPALCTIAADAVQLGGPFINHKVRERFVRRCPQHVRDWATVLRAVFAGKDDAAAFEAAVRTFGANYDLIAFLFYLKHEPYTAPDDETLPFLPLRPAITEDCFARFGMPLKLSKRCDWDNYTFYLRSMQTLRDALQAELEGRTAQPVTLFDAFAFLRTTEEIGQKMETSTLLSAVRTEQALLPLLKAEALPAAETTAKPHADAWETDGITPLPDVRAAAEAVLRANGRCEADPRHKTFACKHGAVPYVQPHYLIPLCFASSFDAPLDQPANIVPLCSFCASLLHYGRDAALLLTALYDKRADALEEAGVGISRGELLRMYAIE